MHRAVTPRHIVAWLCGLGIALICVVLLMRYPLEPWFLSAAVASYVLLLWRFPGAFLIVLPIVIPAFDLGLWTGWTMAAEADLFVLATVGVLLIRTTPRLEDLLLTGKSRVVMLAFVAVWLTATVIGLLAPMGAASDNAFLRPDNALRLAKGLAEALVLLPFLRLRERGYTDGISLLGWGMAAGIAVVTIIVVTERYLFAGIWDFSADYRVAGPFSSMRVGGGHIGAYVVLALPMALCLPRLHPRWLGMSLLLIICLLGGYTLVFTFARTTYLAGSIAMTIAGLGWMRASIRQHRPAALGLMPVILLMVAIAAAGAMGGMRDRFAGSFGDLQVRQENWQAGLAVRDSSIATMLFGQGLGTYQRVMLAQSSVNRPSDIVLVSDGQGAYVSMRVVSPFFFGQKIVPPDSGAMHLALRVRSPERNTTFSVAVCDKVLLYSDQCRGGGVKIAQPDVWQQVSLAMPAAGLGSGVGWLRRPVEMAFSGGPMEHHVEFGDIRLTDDAGHTVLDNADFARGLDRWIFTDDSHVSWRILNVYLMLWFETGLVGAGAFLVLCGFGLAGGVRSAWRGAVTGAAVAGSIAGFMVCGLFDNVLEAPRLATLFFLICLSGLVQWEDRRLRPRL